MIKTARIWEIDCLRGFAIILMVVFHLIVDLKDFYSYPFQYLSGFWFYTGKLSAILFIFTAGISATLGKNTFKHGIKVFLWAMLLTLITYFYNDHTYIRFGILHFLGFSIVSYPLLTQAHPALLTITGLVWFIGGCLFTPIIVHSAYLFPFGLVSPTFESIDYYPIIPWYGVFLLGVAVGKNFYYRRQSLFAYHPAFTPIVSLGQHSLALYLIHQPVLLLALHVVHAI
ncbi:hypothetical protein SDC9_13797 [bioreactor metagenome]|uniref:Heparan-alpha-glucosaminide N-acetyltransferase catalytic domain-containing protein n=1 Tax=bioreactor metagenome TaxID=1076179 RepID=A0A644TMH9_9ZZZZ|nr:heparan-alpha-glucosaminide N-acetyltransferase [Negativicutes bacterium]